MFARFTQEPGGLAIYVRRARVLAFARSDEGGTRIFLSGTYSCLVAEDEETVLAALTDAPENGPTS